MTGGGAVLGALRTAEVWSALSTYLAARGASPEELAEQEVLLRGYAVAVPAAGDESDNETVIPTPSEGEERTSPADAPSPAATAEELEPLDAARAALTPRTAEESLQAAERSWEDCEAWMSRIEGAAAHRRTVFSGRSRMRRRRTAGQPCRLRRSCDRRPSHSARVPRAGALGRQCDRNRSK